MRILLTTAPARYWQTSNFMLTNFPPLALAVVAAAVSPPHEVRIVENSKFRLRSHDLFREVRDFDADVVAFTNNFYPDSTIIQRVSRELKAAFPRLTTVVGGQAPSFLPEEYVEAGVDYVVRYEAEQTFAELIDYLAGTGSTDRADIAGLAYREETGAVVITRKRELLTSFDDLPSPRWDLLPYYPSFLHKGYPSTAIETVRGCPYHCRFCTRPTFWGKHRDYSNERILADLAHIKELGFRELMFTDDTMAYNPTKMAALCEEMIRRDLTIPFGGALRADTAVRHPELIKLMRRAGLFLVNVGFESYSKQALKGLAKTTTVDFNRQATQVLRDNGVLILGSHIYGAPGQTDDELKLITRDGMEHCDFFRMNMYTPQVGSALYYDLIKQGKLQHHDPEDYNQFEYLLEDDRDANAMKRGFVMRQLQYYAHPRSLKAFLRAGNPKEVVIRRAYISGFLFTGYRSLRKLGVEIL